MDTVSQTEIPQKKQSDTRRRIAYERFTALAKEWREMRPISSSVEKLAMHPTYQQIIGMGQDAIPLILAELNREPDQWFWALRTITGENPEKPEHRGNVLQMSQDWFDWARINGVH
ncbi:MAG: hypothetical protein U0798_20945 [Gemmataceae bacterium]